MTEEKNDNNFFCKKEDRSVKSFYEVFAEVKSKICLETFLSCEIEQATEICLIISEVKKLNSEGEIKISGVMLSVDMVQEIYDKITADHVKLVIDNFSKIDYEIRNKKAYLRTSLYNSVFEFESHYTNQVKKDLGC